MHAHVRLLLLLSALILLCTPAGAADGDGPFSPGSWTGQVYGSVMNDVSGHSDVSYVLTAGIGYFFLPGFSLSAEISGLAVTQDGDDAQGMGVALVPRWHFYRASDWSVYADGGLGLVWTNEDVPPGAKKQNFQEFVGLGFTRLLGQSLSLMAGARYHHISNAHGSDNPGLDNVEGYVGLMVPF